MIVTHPNRPEWGQGQVQSVIGDKVTVMFQEAGKVVINSTIVQLDLV